MGDKLFGFDTDLRWDYENGFYLTSDSTRLSKALAQYELYKMIVTLPGHIVECGVYKGASLIRFATFRAVLENPYSRKVIGFDTFGKFPIQNDPIDSKLFRRLSEKSEDKAISAVELRKVFEHKPFDNYEFIQGDILETIPKYLVEHPELKIALLHIDVDAYKPASIILEKLFDRVVRNGLILFDNFGTAPGAGETMATDEYLSGKDIIIEKLPISQSPSFIRKK